jgi:hypothetical protein
MICMQFLGRGGGVHVGTFAHNKSGIAYQDKSQRPETIVTHKRKPLRQPKCIWPGEFCRHTGGGCHKHSWTLGPCNILAVSHCNVKKWSWACTRACFCVALYEWCL